MNNLVLVTGIDGEKMIINKNRIIYAIEIKPKHTEILLAGQSDTQHTVRIKERARKLR